MSSSWIRAALKYSLLLAPTVFLVGLLEMVWLAAGATAVLRDPATLPEAPALVRKLAQSVYWHTRLNWHQVPDCVEFDRDLLYRPRAGSCRFENPEFSTTIHMESNGGRSTTPAAPGTPGSVPKPRLVIVGDSHAMGWGVEDDETFASVLSRVYGYPTVNLAVPSYGTSRELLRLRRDFALAPDDILLIQYCDNDLDENRRFARQGAIGPYEEAAFDAMARSRPVATSPLPVAGLILRMLWRDLLALTAERRQLIGETGGDPSATFLAVLRAFPEALDRQTLVIAINGPGKGTHLQAAPLAAARLTLVVPDIAREDYFALDDHMRPRGHRAMAGAIDAAIRQISRQRSSGRNDGAMTESR